MTDEPTSYNLKSEQNCGGRVQGKIFAHSSNGDTTIDFTTVQLEFLEQGSQRHLDVEGGTEL